MMRIRLLILGLLFGVLGYASAVEEEEIPALDAIPVPPPDDTCPKLKCNQTEIICISTCGMKEDIKVMVDGEEKLCRCCMDVCTCDAKYVFADNEEEFCTKPAE